MCGRGGKDVGGTESTSCSKPHLTSIPQGSIRTGWAGIRVAFKSLLRRARSFTGDSRPVQSDDSVWSLALIGNASGQTLGVSGVSIRGVFDKETRRKPLAFAADAARYGI